MDLKNYHGTDGLSFITNENVQKIINFLNSKKVSSFADYLKLHRKHYAGKNIALIVVDDYDENIEQILKIDNDEEMYLYYQNMIAVQIDEDDETNHYDEDDDYNDIDCPDGIFTDDEYIILEIIKNNKKPIYLLLNDEPREFSKYEDEEYDKYLTMSKNICNDLDNYEVHVVAHS